MLAFLILILPSFACLFCVFQNYLFSRRTSTFVIFQILLLAIGVFCLADSLYAAPAINPHALGVANIVKIVAASCLIPLAWMYLRKLKSDSRFASWQYLWLAIPVYLLATGAILHGLSGSKAIASFLDELNNNGTGVVSKYKGEAEYLYYVFTSVVFRVIVTIEALGAVGYLVWYLIKEKLSPGDLLRFASKDAKCSPLELQLFNFILPIIIVFVKVILQNGAPRDHLWLNITLAIIITLCILNISFTSLFGAIDKISFDNMRNIVFYNHNKQNKSAIIEHSMNDILNLADENDLDRLQRKLEERIPKHETESVEEAGESATAGQLFATMAGTWDDENLLARFQKLVVKEKMFLKPGLSITEVAEQLHTNKTYVSKLVNNTYNIGFPELLNALRIDYAEQYILSHKGAKQAEIAEACGFLSASSFNNIFKKVKGIPPRMWIESLTDKNHKTD